MLRNLFTVFEINKSDDDSSPGFRKFSSAWILRLKMAGEGRICHKRIRAVSDWYARLDKSRWNCQGQNKFPFELSLSEGPPVLPAIQTDSIKRFNAALCSLERIDFRSPVARSALGIFNTHFLKAHSCMRWRKRPRHIRRRFSRLKRRARPTLIQVAPVSRVLLRPAEFANTLQARIAG